MKDRINIDDAGGVFIEGGLWLSYLNKDQSNPRRFGAYAIRRGGCHANIPRNYEFIFMDRRLIRWRDAVGGGAGKRKHGNAYG